MPLRTYSPNPTLLLWGRCDSGVPVPGQRTRGQENDNHCRYYIVISTSASGGRAEAGEGSKTIRGCFVSRSCRRFFNTSTRKMESERIAAPACDTLLSLARILRLSLCVVEQAGLECYTRMLPSFGYLSLSLCLSPVPAVPVSEDVRSRKQLE